MYRFAIAVLLVSALSKAYAKPNGAMPNALSLIAERIGEDLRASNFNDFTHMAVRSVSISENLSPSYRPFVETMVLEQIARHTKIRLIQCEPCKARVARQVDDHLLIATTKNSSVLLDDAAKRLNIDYFLDIILMGDAERFVVSLEVISQRTKDQLWVQSYDGKSGEDRRWHDDRQSRFIAKARSTDHYVPDFQYWIGLGFLALPNLSGGPQDSRALGLHLRATEQFLDGRAQFGVMGGPIMTMAGFAQPYPALGGTNKAEGAGDDATPVQEGPKPFTIAGMIAATYYHGLFGDLRRLNQLRGGINFATGALASKGYGTPMIRVGGDVYLGPKGAVSLGLVYLQSAKVNVGASDSFVAHGGLGADLVLAAFL